MGAASLDFGVDDGLRESEHADDSGSVVAGAGGGETIGIVVSGERGIERRSGGKDSIEMRGEDDDGPGAVGGKMRRGNESDDVADGVGCDIGETDFCEAMRRSIGSVLLLRRAAREWQQVRPGDR